MKMRIFATAAVAMVLTTATIARAASGNASAATGSAAGTLVAPIVLTHTSGTSLNFGQFTVGTGGTVVVTAAGAGSVTSSVAFVPGSTTAADQFALTGDKSRNFGITTTNSTISNGTKTINFTTSPSAVNGTTSATGTASFSVGGTLTLTGSETPGSYTGSYNATVIYQ